ncbi:unnamed protein product [Meganyctiphanes norvegica]|uniref:NACHT domain-containing protein n=1 Tax=Meganyctiphanes norvegica TaxID=48144 RepID=A0AAV2RRC7_MEGNR
MSDCRNSKNMSISNEHHWLSMGSFLLGFLMPLDKLPLPRWPPGFTKEDFEFSKLYKCVQEEGSKAMQKLFRTTYSHSVMNTDNGKMPFRKYLKDICKKTDRNIRRDYGFYIKEGLLDCNLMDEDFDISFGYKRLEEILRGNKEKISISEELWKEAIWLKKYRNKIAHIYGFMNGDLYNALDSLCGHLRNIYELLQKEFSISLTTEIDIMEKNIEESKLSEIRQDDMESYIQDVKKFRNDNIVYITIEGRKEIYKKGSKGIYLLNTYLRSLNPCTFLVYDKTKNFNLCENFVIPKILKNAISFQLKDLFTALDDKYKEVPKVIYMKGKSNSGKTSLCKFLLHSWATNKKSIIRKTDFDLAFYINVFSLKSNSLELAFKNELLPKTTSKFQDIDIIPTLQDLNVIFFIDGFELRNKQTNPIIEEIFSKFGEQSIRSRIFVTTTPDDTDAVVQLAIDYRLPCLSLELEGFDETQIKELSKNVFKSFQLENIEKNSYLFEAHINNLTLEAEYLKLPGFIIMICILWIEDKEVLANPQSLTSLYQNIFKLCQEKFSLYLKTFVDLDIEMKNVNEIFHVVGQSYLSSLEQGTFINSQDIFRGIEAVCPMKGNEQKIVSKLFDAEDDVCFLINKTQMQYLAASYLYSQVNESDIKELLQFYDIHNLNGIIPFIVGIANIKGQFDSSLASDTFATIKNQLFITSDDFEFWWTLVSECPNMDSYGYDNDICSLVAHVLEKDWIIKKNNVVKAIQLLLFTPVRPKSIQITIPIDKDPFFIPGLNKAVGNHLFQLHDSKDSFKIEANFYEQFKGNNLSYSDQFILPFLNLYPHIQLVSFTGHIGNDITVHKKLGKCYKLESLNVRLTNIESFKSLLCLCLCKLKGLKNIHICLDFPTKCDPNQLPHFPPRKGRLSLTFPKVTGVDDLSWLDACIHKITNSNGCQELHGAVGFEIPKDLLQKMGIKELQ